MEVEVDQRALPKKKKKKGKATAKENDDEIGLSPDSENTKAKLEELLKAAVDQSKSDGKKKKTKKKTQEELLLQTIKSGKSIKKDTEDTSMAANTYNEDESPRTRKNTKNKKKSHAKEMGVENDGYIEETALDSQLDTPKKSTKKKTKKKTVLSDDGGEMTISELEDTPRKKTKKKKPKAGSPTPDDDKTGDEIERIKSADEATKTEDDGERTDAAGTPRKVKKKKKKKAATVDEEATAEEVPAAPVDDQRVLGVYIHRSDRLKTDLNLTHPVVRVQIVDLETGNYVKKKDSSRAVTSYYEKENDKVDFILPIMTQPFDFKKRKTVIPAWEELLLFNESYLYFIQALESYPKVIVFFELLDFVSMNAASVRYNNATTEGGWHRIAWAFLKIVGTNGAPNTEKKIRLQLFHPPFNYRKKPGSSEVYQWWMHLPRQAYPSTLYVTLKGIRPPDNIRPSVRSMFATQMEEGSTTYKDLRKSIEWGGKMTARTSAKTKSLAMWSRLPGQVCHIPNKTIFQLNAGRKGCFVIKFSHDGSYLACGGGDREGYPISIFDMPSGRLRGQLPGHYSIIYDLCWSPSDTEILSASSDGTARIWDVESLSSSPSRIFPHPAFVYTARYHPANENIIVTGGYDHVVRVWTKQSEQLHGELLHELEGHKGFINCLCFSLDGDKMYTADSIGTIIIWNSEVGSKPKAKGLKGAWKIEKIIAEREMEGVIINNIKLHPSGRRLLVHGRDNNIRMLDLRIFTIMQRYQGVLNVKEQIRSTMSACGTFVISGSEDREAIVWNTDTGDRVATYSDFGYKHPVSDVEYHPHDHIIAFCSFGENHLVRVYTYDAKVAQIELGIRRQVKEANADTDEKDATLGSTRKSDLQTMLATKERASEALSLQQARRMDSVSKKLASVSMTGTTGALGESYLQHSTIMTAADVTMNSTWGSTFDRTWQTPTTDQSKPPKPESKLKNYLLQMPTPSKPMQGPRPAFMAPSLSMGPAHLEQQYQTATAWRKGPNISLGTGPGGKAQFTYSGLPQPLKDIKYRRVVAMYDYFAQRSDELNIKRHDVITVLHQDSDTWWMGELSNGQQGYFPSNYVTPEEEIERDRTDGDTQDEIEQVIERPSLAVLPPSESDDLLDDAARPKKRTKARTKTQMSAVVSKSGEFKILSGAEETGSDIDRPTAPTRRKKKKQPVVSDAAEATTDGETPRKPRTKPKRRGSRESLLDDDDAPPVTTDTEKKGGKRKTKTKHVERTV